MKLLYWKTISSAFLVAAANYWFGELFINNFATTDEQQRPLVVVAFFFPTTFLGLPILGGILIDYIGVVPILQYLNVVYIIGAAIFVLARCLANPWLTTVAALFFGFSLFLTYMATFTYLCNTFITKSKKIHNLRRVQGIYIFIGCILLCIASAIKFIPYKYAWIISFACGGLIILISSVTSFSLTIKVPHHVIRPASACPLVLGSAGPLECSESSDSRTRSLVRGESIEGEGTFIEYNEKFDQDEVNVQTFSRFIKTVGWKNNLKILTLGIITGAAWTSNYPKAINLSNSTDYIWISITFLAHYFSYAVFGLGLSFMNWNKKRLEKAIVISGTIYALCVPFDTPPFPTDLPWLIAARYVIQTATNAINYYVVLLYFPYTINFKLEGLGKGIGLFWWIVSVEGLLGICLLQAPSNILAFELVIAMPTILAVVVFGSLVWFENRPKEIRPHNSIPICI